MSDQIIFLGQDAKKTLYALVAREKRSRPPYALRGELGHSFESVPCDEWGRARVGHSNKRPEQPFIKLHGGSAIPLELLDRRYYALRGNKICLLELGSYELASNVLSDMFDDSYLNPSAAAIEALERLRQIGIAIPLKPTR